MKIGLYFGSFNPIHNGHLIIASHALNQSDLQQIWFVVSPQNPFKQEQSLLNEYHRLHLVQLAVENDARFRASEIEFKLPRPSYTSDTLVYLAEKYPQHAFTVLMGSDGFQNLPKWKNAQWLMQNHRIMVYLRPGFPLPAEVQAQQQQHGLREQGKAASLNTNESTAGSSFSPNMDLVVLEAPFLSISATFIRHNIQSGKSIRYLLPDAVREYIESNRYYL